MEDKNNKMDGVIETKWSDASQSTPLQDLQQWNDLVKGRKHNSPSFSRGTPLLAKALPILKELQRLEEQQKIKTMRHRLRGNYQDVHSLRCQISMRSNSMKFRS